METGAKREAQGSGRRAQTDPRRLLVRGVNWLGDAVMTTPALLRLRERFPNAHITLAVQSKLADLWASHPAVDEVLPLKPPAGLWSAARLMRQGRHDVALAMPNSHRSALELWLARIPRRFGLAAPVRSWLLTDPVAPVPGAMRMRKPTVAEVQRRLAVGLPQAAPPSGAHQLHHYLHLVEALGADPTPLAPRLCIQPAEVQAARARFGLSASALWVALNPGAEYGPAKRWPADRFAAAAVEVARRVACRWVLLGGGADTGLAQEIEKAIRQAVSAEKAPVNLAGKTTLRELCAVLGACRTLLTNDTGPMHVAAALGLRVVALFGSTSPELTGPGLPGEGPHRWVRQPVACAPCYLRECPVGFRCLRSIEVQPVVEAVVELLGSRDDGSQPA